MLLVAVEVRGLFDVNPMIGITFDLLVRVSIYPMYVAWCPLVVLIAFRGCLWRGAHGL